MEIIARKKGQSTEWEKIFASYSLDKGLIPRLYKDYIIQLINKQVN
jgi:hypothetical protein